MTYLLNGLLLIGSGLLALQFYRYLTNTNQLISTLESKIVELRQQLQARDAPLPLAPVQRPNLRVAIEVADPIATAKKQSHLAKIFSGIAPTIVTHEVYKQVRKETILEMKKKGVEAHVTIIHV